MDMEMKYSLLTLFAIGLEQGDARRMENLIDCHRNSLGCLHRCRSLFGRQIEQGRSVPFDRYQRVTGVQLPDIHEGQREFIFMDSGSGQLAGYQSAKDTALGCVVLDIEAHRVLSSG